MAVETTHRFERDWIETRWQITAQVRGRYTVDVLFPTWGKDATIEAVLFGGKRVTLAGPGQPRRKCRCANVAYFYLAGEDTGYVVLPVERRPKAVAHVAAARARSRRRPGRARRWRSSSRAAAASSGSAWRCASPPRGRPSEAALIVRSLGLGRRAEQR